MLHISLLNIEPRGACMSQPAYWACSVSLIWTWRVAPCTASAHQSGLRIVLTPSMSESRVPINRWTHGSRIYFHFSAIPPVGGGDKHPRWPRRTISKRPALFSRPERCPTSKNSPLIVQDKRPGSSLRYLSYLTFDLSYLYIIKYITVN